MDTAVKPGYMTTEFWINAVWLGAMIYLLVTAFRHPGTPPEQVDSFAANAKSIAEIVGPIIAALVSQFFYTKSRTTVKTETIRAEVAKVQMQAGR